MNPGAPSLDVALVGREQPGDENLALRYLAAALAEAGHRAHIVPLLGPGHLETAVRTVHELRVPVVGVSIPDTDVAIDGFAFVRLLRRRGHVGHVTCGGPLATLIRKEILARQPGFDSVVRQEGEVPIVALADRLAQGRAWTDVPGITVREGDGPPAPVADLTPLRLRPFRPLRLPRILGVPVARMLASRGCPGRCAYCGPAALQREAVAEGLRAGIDAPTLARRGVGGTRRRAPGDVADEVAALHHERNARFFVLLDDNLLGGDPPRAAAWLRELHAELDRRRVGRTAWSMQLEAASVTDEVLRAVVGLGAVRVLVGVEALTDDGLRALGRPGSAAAGLEVVRRLRTSGAVANFNVLLVHPQATAASLRAEIEALASVPELHSDALSLAVNSGTELWRRLWHAGELTGGVLSWRHEMRDPVVLRFRSLLVRLRLLGMGVHGASVLAHDVAVNAALAARLGLPGWDPAVAAEADRIVTGLNGRRAAAFREALDLAEADVDAATRTEAAARLIGVFRREMQGFSGRLATLQSRLERAVRTDAGTRNLFFRSAVAATFVLCGSAAVGCYGSHGEEGERDTDVADRGADGAAGEGEAADEAAVDDADRSAEDAATRDDGSPDEGATDADGGCTLDERSAETVAVQRPSTLDLCPSCVDGSWTNPPAWNVVIDSTGRAVDVVGEDGTPATAEIRACYLEALAGETFPCLAGEEVWQICYTCLL